MEKTGWTNFAKKVVLHSQGRKEHPTYNKQRKADWIRHILHRNYHLKYVIEGKTEGTRRRGRRHMHIPGALQEKRRYWNLKQELLDHIDHIL
jgi:hypothetical protein